MNLLGRLLICRRLTNFYEFPGIFFELIGNRWSAIFDKRNNPGTNMKT
ncbi:MAG: hypothetical protein V7K27_11750 [Nostoc sp.]